MRRSRFSPSTRSIAVGIPEGFGGDDDIDERYRYSEPDFSPLHDRRRFDARLGGRAELVTETRPRRPRRARRP